MDIKIRKLAKRLREENKHDLCDALIARTASKNSISPRSDLSYSFVMRQLRQNGDDDRVKAFQSAYKEAFDEAYIENIDDIDEAALLQAMQVAKIKPDELDDSSEMIEIEAEVTYNLTKVAQAATDLGEPAFAGHAISEIIKFLMRKISFEKRPHNFMKMRQKILELNEHEMAEKNSPDTASMGQSITLIKTLLNGKDPAYIRETLKHVVGNLV